MVEVDLTSGGQDRKFMFKDGHFVNRVSGEAIPLDEPVIIFRARDKHALPILLYYLERVEEPHHKQAIKERLREFTQFAENNLEKMKEPGITRHVVLDSERIDTV